MSKLTFETPHRCLVSVFAATTPGAIHITGITSLGQSAEETAQVTPTPTAFTWGYRSMRAYREVVVTYTGLEGAEVVVGSENVQQFTFHGPKVSNDQMTQRLVDLLSGGMDLVQRAVDEVEYGRDAEGITSYEGRQWLNEAQKALNDMTKGQES